MAITIQGTTLVIAYSTNGWLMVVANAMEIGASFSRITGLVKRMSCFRIWIRLINKALV